ncbi:hypothetical protein ATZ33_00120 [Enterococcus silesiacus]|uniref:Electron transfer flavoprotein small subunit n=1 Tax=Enterococcus silesiacus TaxID=332949 RepID=A0ABM5W443_9ENTE|nr:hypothetical protein [Enterococcus silesiacus]ALR99842.1 hypothetical protein ATZ33_00120 [Enterococcus silesiacus]
MRLVVCLKIVRTKYVYPNEERNETFTLNPYDHAALLDCLKLKEATGCEVICLSMGSNPTKDVLLKTIALGADRAILLSDSKFSGADTVATSKVLAEAIKKIGYIDLLVCGEKSVDGETGQVGFGIGECLGIPCISQVTEVLDNKNDRVILDKKAGNLIQTVSAQLPVLLSYETLTLSKLTVGLLALKKSKREGIEIWDAESLGIDPLLCGIKGSKTKVWRIEKEKKQKKYQKIEGTVEEKVNHLMKILNATERV